MKPIAWILVILFVIFAVALFIVKERLVTQTGDTNTPAQNLTPEQQEARLLQNLGESSAATAAERKKLEANLGASATPSGSSAEMQQKLLEAVK